MTVRDFGVMDMIVRNAKVHREREAVVQGSRRLTFRGYLEKCMQLAAGFRAAGAQPGERIALLAPNGVDYMLVYGAAALSGMIVVPVNGRLTQEEIQYVLHDSSPSFLMTSPDFFEMTLHAEKSLPAIKSRYIFAQEERGDYLPLASLCGTAVGLESIDADLPYVLIYTAAVAGRPRGALLSQGNVLALGTSLGIHFNLGPEDCHLCFLPLFHIAGLSVTVAVMQAGGKNVMQEKFDPDETLDLIEKERGTIFYSFPPTLDRMMEKQRERGRDISSLRVIGGLNPPQSVERFQEIAPQVRFAVMYGQTEAMAVTNGWYDEKPGSAGRIAALARVRIVDETDHEVPVGTVGEICVKSPCVFLSYWRLDEETSWTLRNGWHHTGDRGRLDEEGFLWYTGRMPVKELIKTGGENVYPAEVEKVILEHPAVAEVCVIGVPDVQWGEAIQAVCVLATGQSAAELELIDFVASRLARYKKPKHVVFVDTLPKSADGTIDRTAVKRTHGGLY
jgi:acyl-CoA synthetase (AMP-forming)/AMP-acid ligase II